MTLDFVSELVPLTSATPTEQDLGTSWSSVQNFPRAPYPGVLLGASQGFQFTHCSKIENVCAIK